MDKPPKIDLEDENVNLVRELLIKYREERRLTCAEMAAILRTLTAELLWVRFGEAIKDIAKEKPDT